MVRRCGVCDRFAKRNMGLHRRFLAIVITGLLLTVAAGAQQPPTFESGTQVVQVDVRVFDKSGRFITDLKPEDFEVKEDGVPQPIGALTLVDEPGTPNQNQNQNANPNPNPNANLEANRRTAAPPNPRTTASLRPIGHP
jgi:hypothetical protein